MKREIIVSIIMLTCIMSVKAQAQERIDGVVEFDHVVHDFGDVFLGDGPLSCEFKMTNISSKPIVIYDLTTSCGCTDAKWTREPIRPGQSTTVSTTYTNDEGPHPFGKNITLYVSDVNRPIVLKIKGSAHKRQETLEQMFPVTSGMIGIEDSLYNCGILYMGQSKSDGIQVANLSDSPIKLGFTNISDGLSLSVDPNPIPPRGTAQISYTITSLKGVWGKNFYRAAPVVSGKQYRDEICIEAFTMQDFSKLTETQKKNAPLPVCNQSFFHVGKIKAGIVVTAVWELSNKGKSTLKIYKVDFTSEKASYKNVPDVAAGRTGRLSVTLDTGGMPQGELRETVSLTTNSPSRPVVQLYITGWIY